MPNNSSKDNNAKTKKSEADQKEAVDELRQLIDFEGMKSPSKVLQDEFLLRFLRTRNFDVERSFELLKNFKKLRQNKNFKNFLPSKLQVAKEQKVCRLLKGTDVEGRSVLIVQQKTWDPSTLSHMEGVLYVMLMLWETLFDPRIQENGITVVWDADSFTIRHLSAVSFESTKLGATAVGRNSYPLKLKKIIVVKPTALVLIFWRIFAAFLSRKLLSRVTMVDESFTALHKILDPAVLPEYLGGTLSEEDAFDSEIENRLFNNEQYYKNMTQLFSHEN